ncbi:MAG: hypothetical protein ACKOAD_03960 [Gammaproteobacteria bacterium]
MQIIQIALYEQMLEIIENAELLVIAKKRLEEKAEAIRVAWDEL